MPFKVVDIDANDGSTRKPAYLARNPNGKVPLVEFPDGWRLAESNAILLHLGEGTSFLPSDTFDRAKVYEWLFFEQYSHEPSIAVRRSLTVYPERRAQATPERMTQLHRAGNDALNVMETRLATADWLAGADFSVADIALYAYTHMAGEGGFDLDSFAGITAWLARIAARPGHVTIDWRPA